MNLKNKLKSKKNRSGNYISYGIFLCSYCNKEVEKQLSSGKKAKSCGCIWHKSDKENPNYKHGKSFTKLYNSHHSMKQRCLNHNATGYKNYGGRGITVCDEWLNFINFKNWALNNGYKEGLTIHRKNNNLGYCPENCEWITKTENNRKRDYNKIKSLEQANEIRFKYNTKNYTMKQLAEEYDVSIKQVSNIINGKSWDFKK